MCIRLNYDDITLFEGIIVCGVNNVNTFDDQNASQRLVTDLFTDDFSTFIDKSFEDLDTNFKSYLDLTDTQGYIRLLPVVNKTSRSLYNIFVAEYEFY